MTINPRPLRRVLIANRGEIAARIARSCRAAGIDTVAVFSDADEDAPHVRSADLAVRIGPAPSRESYLVVERILDAARATDADAIHPGYGFLAENADFAQAVLDAGLTWIGPTPDAIRAMGSKIEAKTRAEAADVPIVPGYNGAEQSTSALAKHARDLGFPLLLKASAGGGGKGMRILRDDKGLEEAIDAARREAENAFGDGALMLERYIDRPRHIEFQILGDAHGNVVHVFERECSIQRRHQKIIEETPSMALDDALRDKMGRAAAAMGQAIGYQSAGTVEFILAPNGEFYFLEVNTRLQVEHPITEMVTGLDLVAEQLRLAEGAPLGYTQDDLKARGAAVECRIYAEDPANGFLPATGTLVDWHLPPQEGLRVDSGVEPGQVVSPHYDPMLAKIITWGSDRREANRRMSRALRTLSVQGVQTNRDFLLAVLDHPAYREGALTTHFIEEHMAEALEQAPDRALVERAAMAATVSDWADRRDGPRPLPTLETGYRNNPYMAERDDWQLGEDTVPVRYHNLGGGRLRVTVAESDPQTVALVDKQGPAMLIEDGHGVRRPFRVVSDSGKAYVHALDGAVAFDRVPRFVEPGSEEVEGGCTAPMPGRVVRVEATVGASVEAGDALVILEAMKMEHTVRAPADGKVAEVAVEVGDQVEQGAVLVVLD